MEVGTPATTAPARWAMARELLQQQHAYVRRKVWTDGGSMTWQRFTHVGGKGMGRGTQGGHARPWQVSRQRRQGHGAVGLARAEKLTHVAMLEWT